MAGIPLPHSRFRAGGILLSLMLGLASSSGLAAPDPAAVEANVIRIVTRRSDGSDPVSGTGFWIRGSQVLVTNSHVVGDGRNVFVLVPGDQGVEQLPAKVLRVSDTHDIALLSVAGLARPGLLLSPLTEVSKGQPAWAIGYPAAADRGRFDRDNLEATLTAGVVNRTLRQSWEGGGPLLTILQHDAKLSHGNSGGPLLDTCGHVMGINTRIEIAEQALETYNYALSVTELRRLLGSWGVNYHNADSSCRFVAGSTDTGLVSGLAGIAVVLAATALVLVLRGPRERVIYMVESYTRYRRRLQLEHGAQTPEPDLETVSRFATPKPETAILKLVSQGKTLCMIEGDAAKPCRRTLGRSMKLCDEVLDYDTVSRCHAGFFWDPLKKKWYVEDLESRNGTRLNGRPLKARIPASLQRGDRLILGQLEIEVALYSGSVDKLEPG